MAGGARIVLEARAVCKRCVEASRRYCQQAVCSPSRNSFNWGRYPKTTKIWNFKSSTRENSPEAVTLPQYMKDTAKYVTTGMGKIVSLAGGKGEE